ncbi:unnamed protein product, partial [Cuscuta epithymum]
MKSNERSDRSCVDPSWLPGGRDDVSGGEGAASVICEYDGDGFLGAESGCGNVSLINHTPGLDHAYQRPVRTLLQLNPAQCSLSSHVFYRHCEIVGARTRVHSEGQWRRPPIAIN